MASPLCRLPADRARGRVVMPCAESVQHALSQPSITGGNPCPPPPPGRAGLRQTGPVTSRVRTAIRVQGVVQGVGFRPFVYALATRLGLAGWVGNDVDGVFAEVEGPAEAVQKFLFSVQAELGR